MTVKKGIYRHFKGNLYEVLEVGTHSETQEQQVVYRALYGERGIWIRPLAMFLDTVECDGNSCKRFTWIESSDGTVSNQQQRQLA